MFLCLIPVVGFRVREIVLITPFLEPCVTGVTEVLWEMPCLSRFEREGIEEFFRSQIQEQILREWWSTVDVQGPLSLFRTL